jgi:hypothetical protein
MGVYYSTFHSGKHGGAIGQMQNSEQKGTLTKERIISYLIKNFSESVDLKTGRIDQSRIAPFVISAAWHEAHQDIVPELKTSAWSPLELPANVGGQAGYDPSGFPGRPLMMGNLPAHNSVLIPVDRLRVSNRLIKMTDNGPVSASVQEAVENSDNSNIFVRYHNLTGRLGRGVRQGLDSGAYTYDQLFSRLSSSQSHGDLSAAELTDWIKEIQEAKI